MKEIDRIKSEGEIPIHLFQEEDRDDYHVSEGKKEIWAIELDLLLYIDRICQENGLKYFLFFGSLLGAVRHKGFIPLSICA